MTAKITKSDIIRYAALPGFKQRISDLFATGFQYVPFFIALVYGSVRLLPQNHPYLSPENMGRFGIRHVIAEAANNIVVSRKNIDQILLFITILVGLVLVTLQIGLLGLSLLMPSAMAAMPTNFAGFFLTPVGTQQQDLAHIFLDMVFGVPGLFGSCVDTGAACLNIQGNPITRAAGAPGGASWTYQSGGLPMPIHDAMHQLFQMYNIGLTVVAVFISIYFITTVIAETAQSGTAFGKRFNKVWAPVRFVVAFGLLFPVGYGFNSSQYIVLYAAKFGSGFATNGWNIFNTVLSGATAGGIAQNLASSSDPTSASLISRPNIPEVGGLLQFMYVAKTCAYAEMLASGSTTPVIDFYVVKEPIAAPNFLPVNFGTGYNALLTFLAGNNQAIIRFGRRDQSEYGHMMGYTYPTCGEITFKLADPRPVGTAEPGVLQMQRYYWFILQELWFRTYQGNGWGPTAGPNYALHTVQVHSHFNNMPAGMPHNTGLPLPDTTWSRALQDFYYTDITEALTGAPAPGSATTNILPIIGSAGGAVNDMALSTRWNVDVNLTNKGWAGAAVWYNRIAELNGGMISAALNIPLPTRYPHAMEIVYQEKRQGEEKVSFRERFNPTTNAGRAVEGLTDDEAEYVEALWQAFNFWQQGDGVTSTHTSPTGNSIIDIINALFGTEGLFSMRRNANVHPLAQLTGVGRSLVEGAVRNLTYAAVGGAGGALLSMVDQFSGATAATFSSFLITFAMVGLTAGFILFYVVPFLPFIYFFFAVGGWVKGIFEAMVGAPLWALAHLRIDGNGLSGQAAVSGYFLILEVFLRPILIVFGMLASISIFSALVSVLHQVFDLVVANAAGFDATDELTGATGISKLAEMRSAVDEFFFTIIYTIIVYLLGLSSFKLVDLIPNNILRWMGQSVATFGDQREDMGQSLVGTSTIGAQQTLGSIGGGLQSLAKMGG